jgi:hypothetical protein
MDPAVYHRLTRYRGWSPADYESGSPTQSADCSSIDLRSPSPDSSPTAERCAPIAQFGAPPRGINIRDGGTPNGGSARGYQDFFGSLATRQSRLRHGCGPAWPYFYTSPAWGERPQLPLSALARVPVAGVIRATSGSVYKRVRMPESRLRACPRRCRPGPSSSAGTTRRSPGPFATWAIGFSRSRAGSTARRWNSAGLTHFRERSARPPELPGRTDAPAP